MGSAVTHPATPESLAANLRLDSVKTEEADDESETAEETAGPSQPPPFTLEIKKAGKVVYRHQVSGVPSGTVGTGKAAWKFEDGQLYELRFGKWAATSATTNYRQGEYVCYSD